MNAGKPLLALMEKGVPFHYHYIDLAKREQHSPAFLQINPHGTVPALVHDGSERQEEQCDGRVDALHRHDLLAE